VTAETPEDRTAPALAQPGPAAVFLDFENLVLGAAVDLPHLPRPVTRDALALLCSQHGPALVRRAYADWADRRFGRYQDDLAMNGIDLTQVTRFGAAAKNAADIQMTVDAMETLICHPKIAVYILVTGDSDFTPLARRLREFGKRVVGVGAEASASHRLVPVCSDYVYWPALVAAANPSCDLTDPARPDISEAEQLLVRAFARIPTATPTASALKNKLLTLDATFDERSYGCCNFRDFLSRFPGRIRQTGRSGNDVTVSLIA
jgi:hypothetical protein